MEKIEKLEIIIKQKDETNENKNVININEEKNLIKEFNSNLKNINNNLN